MAENGKTPEERAREHFAEHAESYLTDVSQSDPVNLARLVEVAGAQKDWRALDVAAGTGHASCALAPHVAQVTAVDLTPEMLVQAKRLQASEELTNIAYAVADVHELPFGEESFDLVVCRRAAHHFSELPLALDEMWAVLKPGGRLLIDDRSVPESRFAIACVNQLDAYRDPSHVWEYPPAEWEEMLLDAGFLVETLEPYERHRPLSSLTQEAPGDNAGCILAALDELNAFQRSVLKLVEHEGELYINHWYVLIAARKPY
jgi:ubiquinone/menaquinone biosynthesis C-methylase UbiE